MVLHRPVELARVTGQVSRKDFLFTRPGPLSDRPLYI